MSSQAGPSSPPPASGSSAMQKSKHKLTPAEQQALAVEKLLSNTDREIRLPSGAKEKTMRAPREMMKNVSGSSAGAGSGEFHVYKHARRREYERIKLLEEKADKEKSSSVFLIAQAQRAANDEAKTSKNRAKRDKKKLARDKAKLLSASVGHDQSAGSAASGTGQESKRKRSNGSREADKDLEEPEKKLKAAPGAEGLKFRARGEDDSEADDDDVIHV